ncbi:SDR family oxidoreductase [Candidatus Peregrinibacteria bacterium]|nr:SDR family oxidoreductase [Candidatus Peregrinibacteria bacterium]
MRVLVSGGAGFIGSHLCEALLAKGDDVICVDNFLTGTHENIETFLKHPSFTLIEHDITHPFIIDGTLDEVYNLACPASPVDYQNLPLETLFASALGTRNMLDVALSHKSIFLHTSTSEIYGDPLVHPQEESYFGNVNCIGPRSCYDEGKRFAESLVTNYANKYGLSVKIVRVFNTYGPKMRKRDGRVIPNFITQAIASFPLTIYGDGYQTRSFCYVSDMISGILAMMETSNFSGPVNLGNPEEVSIKELSKNIIELCNSNSELVYKPYLENDPKVRRPDITLARRHLHFEPIVSLKDGLQKTINWFKNN